MHRNIIKSFEILNRFWGHSHYFVERRPFPTAGYPGGWDVIFFYAAVTFLVGERASLRRRRQ